MSPGRRCGHINECLVAHDKKRRPVRCHGFLLAPVYSYGYRLEQLAGQVESAAS